MVQGDSVTVTYPAIGGSFTGSHYVNVTVQHTAPTFFAGVFGRGTMTIRGHSTAGLILSEYCFIVLDPTGSSSLLMENTARLTGTQCGIAVNSTSDTAASATANTLVRASAIGVVGGVSGNTFSPTPELGITPVADPVAWMPTPTVPNTCDHTSLVVTSAMTLSPGTYCGGVHVLNGQATLLPGLYILRGGGLEVRSAGSTFTSTGSGVSFYNTAAPGGGGYGPILMQANVTVNISANTDPNSALPGILYFSDPAAPNLTNVFKAGSGSTMNGTMYFPTQSVEFNSGSTSVINGALVAFRVDIKNSTDLTFTGYNGGSGYDALRRPSIVQ